jgi:hypothetical protein
MGIDIGGAAEFVSSKCCLTRIDTCQFGRLDLGLFPRKRQELRAVARSREWSLVPVSRDS